MITQLYVIYDRIAQECGPIFEAKNDGVAFRMYRDLIQSKEKDPNFTQEEYICYRISSFDRETMVLTPEREPTLLMIGTEVEV